MTPPGTSNIDDAGQIEGPLNTSPAVPSKPVRTPPRAEVVGSLVRPPRLQERLDDVYADARREHRSATANERLDGEDALQRVVDEAVVEAVAKQVEIGLDVVTDGEFSRLCFDNSFWNAVEGFAHDPTPQVYKNSAGDAVTWSSFKIEEPLRLVDSLARREATFLSSITDHPYKITFPSGSYELLDYAMQGPEEYGRGAYPSADEALDAILGLKQELVRDAVDAGARYVQFDYAFYPHIMDASWVDTYCTGRSDPNELFERALAMDNAVRQGLPDDVRVSMHICRGNMQDKWLVEGSLEPIAERLFAALDYDVFLIEWDAPERQGDFGLLRHVPKGTMVSLGLVSTKSAVLEDEDDLLRRVEEAAQYIDVDQLAVATQCGFASVMGYHQLDEDTQWRKLELVARTAERVWGRP
jgi:5-methyltetrahydropteroyltriglutamate--homocysteine methyltransferase